MIQLKNKNKIGDHKVIWIAILLLPASQKGKIKCDPQDHVLLVLRDSSQKNENEQFVRLKVNC